LPSSFLYQVVPIMNAVIEINPQSILDIGIGWGKYALLCREYLETPGPDGGLLHFTRRIDGIEAFEKYVNPVHRHLYDEIFIGDALEVTRSLKRRYDLVFLIDVLEHFKMEDGAALLDRLLGLADGVLVAMPRRYEQSGEFPNPYERHQAEWSLEAIEKIAPAGRILDQKASFVCYLGKREWVDRFNERFFSRKYRKTPGWVRRRMVRRHVEESGTRRPADSSKR
jgi:hypothetical protein